MEIIDPVMLGDVGSSRPSPKCVYDKTGTLITVPAGQVAVTYDPSDLSKAPYLMVENAATNRVKFSQDLSGPAWTGAPQVTATSKTYRGIPFCELVKTTAAGSEALSTNIGSIGAGQTEYATVALMAGTSSTAHIGLYEGVTGAWGDTGGGRIIEGPGTLTLIPGSTTAGLLLVTGLSSTQPTLIEFWRVYASATTVPYVYLYPGGYTSTTIGASILATRVQAEDERPSSYIPTSGTAVTRAADSIASGAGLVYSNVAITETAYSASATYGEGDQVYDPATYMMYQSLIAANTGKALTDTTAWTPLKKPVNRWQMFDQYNNTQTTSAEEILVVVSPELISQGGYIGNIDASEVRISVVDQTQGVVYQETIDLRIMNSGSSFYNWCFKRIKRKTWAVSLDLPPYANALITIAIRKPGGVAKCGMCVVGPTEDLGEALMGLGAEIKDFSDTRFNFDGTSETMLRGWAKRLTVDVSVDSDMVDAVYEALAEKRQKPLAWIGSRQAGIPCVFGRYTSLKPVIKGQFRWEMALQIEGTV